MSDCPRDSQAREVEGDAVSRHGHQPGRYDAFHPLAVGVEPPTEVEGPGFDQPKQQAQSSAVSTVGTHEEGPEVVAPPSDGADEPDVQAEPFRDPELKPEILSQTDELRVPLEGRFSHSSDDGKLDEPEGRVAGEPGGYQ